MIEQIFENIIVILKYEYFYCIFYQVNAALVIIRDFFL